MNSKKTCESLLTFYELLHEVVTTGEFDEIKAEALVLAFTALREIVSLDECTVKGLRDCHGEYNDDDPDAPLDHATVMSEKAFADLAPLLRIPRARKICDAFQDFSYGKKTKPKQHP